MEDKASVVPAMTHLNDLSPVMGLGLVMVPARRYCSDKYQFSISKKQFIYDSWASLISLSAVPSDFPPYIIIFVCSCLSWS
jgi:hypothetical protein